MSLPNAIARSFLYGKKAVFSSGVSSKVPFADVVESDIVSVMVLSGHFYPSYRYQGPHMRHRRCSAPDNAIATKVSNICRNESTAMGQGSSHEAQHLTLGT
jgi:hypothetical protein